MQIILKENVACPGNIFCVIKVMKNMTEKGTRVMLLHFNIIVILISFFTCDMIGWELVFFEAWLRWGYVSVMI